MRNLPVRPLPASPSLDHLRGQAKSLLKAFLAGDAGARERVVAQLPQLGDVPWDRHARLADAQFVLAREYGFPNWARLKTYVEAAGPSATTVNPRDQRRSARRQVVYELAASLLIWSRQHEAQALGARFALMPLRDILAVREQLNGAGELPAVVDGLLEGLRHPRPRVRFDCANALDHLADERCAGPLRRLLDDPVPRVRRAALHSLSCDACKLSPLEPGEDLVPTLINMALSDPSIRVRRAAVPLLESHCRDGRVEETLRTLALSDDPAIGRTAREVLRRRDLLRDDTA
ncbi:HEAT repeat domain-containing protein [Deinococcus aestuarii]|uniref:HEAT repeat domain-containing protein n=1 Tax=Deinococcus aestuarii TaxID=2774531 RepID=UPI001C0BDAB8|nr:HEAT repeat domain-containing protein [Deinococcus aestuarii]